MPRKIERLYVRGPTLGLDARLSPVALDPRAALDVLNMQTGHEQDILRKRFGTSPVGVNLPLSGAVMLIDQFHKMSGAQWPIVVTAGHVYYYDYGTKTWIDITPTVGITGTAADPVSADIILDTFVFTNGIDPIMRWTGPPARVDPLPNTPFKCRAVRKFAERLLALGDVNEPQLVRWTAPGTVDNWTGPGSGGAYLAEGVDWIVTAEPLAGGLVIYKERSIVMCTYVGGSLVFRFDTIEVGIGLPAPKAIINLGNEHIFMGWDNIYSYQGGRSVDTIGDPVQQRMFEEINPEAIRLATAIIAEERNELWFVVPTGTSEVPNVAWVYNYATGRWYRHEIEATTFGYWDREEAITIDQATGTIDEQTARFDDRTFLALSPMIVVGRPDGMVEALDPTTLSDSGRPINAVFVTKEFDADAPHLMKRWLGLEAELLGSRAIVECSIDGGTWQQVADLQLSSMWRRYTIDFDKPGRTIRFRFRNSDESSDLEIRAFAPKFILEGRES